MSLLGHSRRGPTSSRSGHVRCAPESGSEIWGMASAAMDLCGLMVSPRTCHHRLPRNAERSPFPATVDDRLEDDACFTVRDKNKAGGLCTWRMSRGDVLQRTYRHG